MLVVRLVDRPGFGTDFAREEFIEVGIILWVRLDHFMHGIPQLKAVEKRLDVVFRFGRVVGPAHFDTLLLEELLDSFHMEEFCLFRPIVQKMLRLCQLQAKKWAFPHS